MNTALGQVIAPIQLTLPTTGGLPSVDMPLATLDTNTVIFAGTDSLHGNEIWITNGTLATTRLLLDLEPGEGSSDPADFISMGGKVFFTAATTTSGREMHVTDGTTGGTQLLYDASPGAGSGITGLNNYSSYAGAIGEQFIFLARNPQFSYEPHISDGTPSGTRLLKNINERPETTPANFEEGSFAENYVEFGGRTYFRGRLYQFENELHATDGTEAGTTVVYNVTGSGFNTEANPLDLTVYRDSLYFYGNTLSQQPAFLRIDGINNRIDTVYIFENGESYSPQSNEREQKMYAVNGFLIFPVEDSTGAELWRYDGSTGQIGSIIDLPEDGSFGYTPQRFTVLDDVLYYKDAGPDTGIELWRTDGTPEGTQLTNDVGFRGNGSIFLGDDQIAHQGLIYYTAGESAFNHELYVYDPINGLTELAADSTPNGRNGKPRNFLSVGDDLYFTATLEEGTVLYRFGEIPVSINNQHSTTFLENGLSVFPNPAVSGQPIQVSAKAKDIAGYHLLDMNGRIIYSEKFDTGRDRIEILPGRSGVLLIRVLLVDGKVATGPITVH